MHRIDAPMSEKQTTSADGTLISYYVAGTGDNVWIIPPGLGTPLISWKYIFEEFHQRYTMITWDARGTYNSGVPSDDSRMRVEDHVADLVAIKNAEKLDRFALGGWSMAVQISLEYYNRFPDDVIALLLLNGTYEHVLSTAFQIPGANGLFTSILKLGRKFSSVFNPTVGYLLGMDNAVEILRGFQIVTANFDHFKVMVKDFRYLDWDVYFNMMLQYNEHSALPYLEKVNVPTLITAGTKDKMTPVATAEFMRDHIKGSELFIIPNGTHYTVAEYPEILNLRLDKFLRQNLDT